MAVSLAGRVRRQLLLREVNERLADVFSSWKEGARDQVPAEFLCECSRSDCTETLALSLPEYESVRSSPNMFVVLRGHESPEVDRVVAAGDDFSLVALTRHSDLVIALHRFTPVPEGR